MTQKNDLTITTYLNLIRNEGTTGQIASNARAQIDDADSYGAHQFFEVSHDPHLEQDGNKEMDQSDRWKKIEKQNKNSIMELEQYLSIFKNI